MRDQQDCAALGQFAQADEDPVLRAGVEGSRGFIYHQQRRLQMERAGEDQALPLPAGERLSVEPLTGQQGVQARA
ncbi:hypothetical protein ACFW2V_40005 [Streptomyces sp. NPDC058947]|uniref:hypothetical protein n=1 Tax=Streptomyces sp. NPDC058947 TaxID=3346675 RepID=UPI0036BA018C